MVSAESLTGSDAAQWVGLQLVKGTAVLITGLQVATAMEPSLCNILTCWTQVTKHETKTTLENNSRFCVGVCLALFFFFFLSLPKLLKTGPCMHAYVNTFVHNEVLNSRHHYWRLTHRQIVLLPQSKISNINVM